jgi:mRNA interferase MazF
LVHKIKRGDILLADLGENVGSEQSGKRPVVVLQNDIGNRYAPTTIVLPITTKRAKKSLPTHVDIGALPGKEEDSFVLCEQIRTIDKKRILFKIASIREELMEQVAEAMHVSIGM